MRDAINERMKIIDKTTFMQRTILEKEDTLKVAM